MRLKEGSMQLFEKIKFKIKNQQKNIINIDTSDSNISSEDSEKKIMNNKPKYDFRNLAPLNIDFKEVMNKVENSNK